MTTCRPSRPTSIGATALCLAAASAGCTTDQLSEAWQLDRLRVLGARATPAEPQPGETTTFSSLVYVPEGTELGGKFWFGCLPSSASDFGCEVDESTFAAFEDDLTFEEFQAALEEARTSGFIGFEPYIAPTWTPPLDALDGLSEQEKFEGLSVVINISAIPADLAVDETADPSQLMSDVDAVEVAYKRVPVSLATTPNHNPELEGLLIDGVAVLTGGTVAARTGEAVEIEPVIAEGSIETYDFVTESGSVEEREEEPFFTWYLEAGTFDQPFSLYPHSFVEWTAPDQPWTGLVVAVMRDRRGGMAWTHLTLVVE